MFGIFILGLVIGLFLGLLLARVVIKKYLNKPFTGISDIINSLSDIPDYKESDDVEKN